MKINRAGQAGWPVIFNYAVKISTWDANIFYGHPDVGLIESYQAGRIFFVAALCP